MGARPREVADVPANELMWVKVTTDYNWNRNCLQELDIHVHSESDINGGAWSRGKFGSGQIHVIN